MGLYDVAMISYNHKLAAGQCVGGLRPGSARFPAVAVQVEVTTLAEAVEAVEAPVDSACDNMSPELLALGRAGGRRPGRAGGHGRT